MTSDPTPPLVLTPGAGPEAQALLDRWNERLPGIAPWHWEPREARLDDWVRFHTLPDGRQRLRNRRDARTVMRRFRRVVRMVEWLTGTPATLLLVADPVRPDEVRDRLLALFPDNRPWVTHVRVDDLREDADADRRLEELDLDFDDIDPADDDSEDDVEDATDGDEESAGPWPDSTHSFRSGPVDDDLLARIVLFLHERPDALGFLLMPEDLSWAVTAYDGGIDVVMPDHDAAKQLAGRLWPWLPPETWVSWEPWWRRATQREWHRSMRD